MAIKMKCPSCEAELDIPTDPLLAEMAAALKQNVAENAKLREKLEAAGVQAPAPVAAPAAKAPLEKARRRGLTTLIEQGYEGDEDGED